MSGKRELFWIGLVVLVATFGLYVAWGQDPGRSAPEGGKILERLLAVERALGPGSPSSGRVRVMVDEELDPSWGPPDAPVTLVHFSDYDSPESRRVGALVQAAAARSGNKVRVVEKPFPPQAKSSVVSEALFAAQAQRGAEQLAARLVRHQGVLDWTAIVHHAKDAGLDAEALQEALSLGTFRSAVKASKTYGRRVGVVAAPALFVDGKPLDRDLTAERLQASIDEDLALATSRGMSREVYLTWMAEAQPGRTAGPPEEEGSTTLDYTKVYPLPPREDEPAMGKPGAPFTLVVFADLQCPYCATMETTLAQLMKEHAASLRIVWKHFPLSIHRESYLAHEASLAAGEQGRFWDFARLAMSHQDRLDRASLEQYATLLSLDLRRFREALDTGRFKARVEEDLRLAAQLGVKATPTVFLNGRPLRGVDRREIENVLQGKAGGGEAPPAPRPVPAVARLARDDAHLPALGPAGAPTEVLFFVDYESPGCSRLWRVLKEKLAESPEALRVVVTQRPLALHPRAEQMARLALAADRQGRFWEVHEALLSRSDYGTPVEPAALAERLGLDWEALRRDLDAEELRARVNRQVAEADRQNVHASPALLVDRQLIHGSKLEERARAALAASLAAKRTGG